MNRHESLNKSKVTFKVTDASKALRESHERYRTLFNLAPIAVYSCDALGVIQEYNNRAAELWGRKPEPGDTDERFCGSFKSYRPDGSFMPHEQCPVGDVLSGKIPEIHDAEVHIERPDGSRIIVIVNIAPLTDDRGAIIGAINCFNDITERKRADAQLHQLNEQLERRVAERTEELTRSQDRLRAMAAELNVTEQRERQRLAAELHDYLGQLLALSRIKLSQARRQPMPAPAAKIIAEMDEVIDKALTYTRTLVSQLSPLVLHESGLPMALEWLAEQMQQEGLSVLLQVKTKIPTLPKDQALLLFQSVRELLINCVKHAGTHEATVTLEWVHGSLYIQISDQGAGFDPLASGSRKAYASARGFGLLSIGERMLSLGGRFELESSPGNGTTAMLVLPLGDSLAESSFIASSDSILAEAKEPQPPLC
jgi:signal transduction histidine kinase